MKTTILELVVAFAEQEGHENNRRDGNANKNSENEFSHDAERSGSPIRRQ
jgi:hypothetical protein